jgi:hypothetical protein
MISTSTSSRQAASCGMPAHPEKIKTTTAQMKISVNFRIR